MLEGIQTQLKALFWNIISWLFSYLPNFVHQKNSCDNMILSIPCLNTSSTNASNTLRDVCICINRPGGLEELTFKLIGQDSEIFATIGYNVAQYPPPFVKTSSLDQLRSRDIHNLDLAVVKIKYYSINYADLCIRWGLYESAAKYVGWPIVPGFDFSGIVEMAGSNTGFAVGDQVFGFTLFGAYSNRIVVPALQIRRMLSKPQLGLKEYAAIPAVASTALHAVSLAGGWPNLPITINRSALVHSAAGGVGTMLLQILKIQKYFPIVAIVGSAHKVDVCKILGADYVIDKSVKKYKNNKKLLWSDISNAIEQCHDNKPSAENKEIGKVCKKYSAVFDANGIETLGESYKLLDQNGHLVIYGFHSNLPKGTSYLNPLTWLAMIKDVVTMPRYEPMELVLTSKTVSGFNLSFFSEESRLIEQYMLQIMQWLEADKLRISDNITLFKMSEVRLSHKHIHSGTSVGKIVIEA